MSARQVNLSSRSSRIALRVREKSLHARSDRPADPVAAYARAWRSGKVASFDIPVEYREAATR